jgi:hypothetical protein
MSVSTDRTPLSPRHDRAGVSRSQDILRLNPRSSLLQGSATGRASGNVRIVFVRIKLNAAFAETEAAECSRNALKSMTWCLL